MIGLFSSHATTSSTVSSRVSTRRLRCFPGFKIDTVVIRGVNDDELVAMIEFAKPRGAEVRFIEYMDVGGATQWNWDQVVTRAEILARLADHYGGVEPVGDRGSAPADRFRLPDGTVFGIISSTTEPFCRDCDRSRLTADGMWYLCLYAARGTDLRAPLRAGATSEELASLITDVWQKRSDRGAEAAAGDARSLGDDSAQLAQARSASRNAHTRRVGTRSLRSRSGTGLRPAGTRRPPSAAPRSNY